MRSVQVAASGVDYDHALVNRRTVNVRPRQPWRNDELQRMRQHVRQAERKWRLTRLVVHRQIYTNLRVTYKQNISSDKSDYYCAKIESSSGNTKEVYHITNRQTCQVSRNFREAPEMGLDLHVSRKCYKISRNLGNLINLIFFCKKSMLLVLIRVDFCVNARNADHRDLN